MESIGLVSLLLISLLDSNSFRVRHSAHMELERMGVLALPHLMAVDKSSLSLESTMRVKRLLHTHNQTMINCIVGNVAPYIDSIPDSGIGILCPASARHEVMYFYLQLAKSESLKPRLLAEEKMLGPQEKFYEYRLAGRLWLEDLLANGANVDEIVNAVGVLQSRCKFYLKNNNRWPEQVEE